MKNKKYSAGGILQGLAPLANFIPGVGTAVSAGMSILGGLLPGDQPTSYRPANGINTNQYGYASGGGIHIKSENKGKFTAYKNRTGKTTEEALHSKNPHVRQMANFARNAKHWNHATGGAIEQISPTGTSVIGGSGVKDGVSVNVNGTNINVDHGEVISQLGNGPVVFSNRITDPKTGKTYAEQAKPIEKALNRVKLPSVINNNTREALNSLKTNLFKAQEYQAQMMGERNADGSTKQSGATNSWGNSYGQASGGYVPKLPFDQAFQGQLMAPGENFDVRNYTGNENPILDNTQSSVPDLTALPGLKAPSRIGQYTAAGPNNLGYYIRPESNLTAPIPMLNPQARTSDPARLADVKSLAVKTDPGFYPEKKKSNIDISTGDAIQFGATGIKALAALLDTPEKQRAYLDTTPVSKQVYDPSRAFSENAYATNAAYVNAGNSYSSAGVNASQQNINANAYRANANIASHYDQMNKQEATNYENRLGNKNRFNQQQLLNTDITNAQNRAAYTNNLYTALESVNNLGQGLNARKTQLKGLQWLAQVDPAAYQAVVNQTKK